MEMYGFESMGSLPGDRYGNFFLGKLFGGGGPKPYKSKEAALYEKGAKEGVFNRAGVTRIENPEYTKWNAGQASNVIPAYTPGVRFSSREEYDKWAPTVYGGANQKAPEQYTYDFSGVGRQLQGPEGVRQARSGYDFYPIDKSIAGFQNPQKFSQTYDPYKFNFEALPEEYAANEYALGSKDVRRESAGALQRTKEAVGTRRPGLLLRAAEGNERNLGETLAGLNLGIRNKMLDQKTQLGRDQQLAQAEQNYRGYQSKADLESKNADEIFRYLNALNQAGQGKIQTESGLMENERAYQDAGLDRLIDLFKAGAGLQNQAAAQGEQRRGNTLGFLGGLAKAFSPF